MSTMPDLPHFMAEITEDRSLSDDTPFLLSNQDADKRSCILSSSAASTIPDVEVPSPPTSRTAYLPNTASSNEQVSSDSTSTTEASDKNPEVEIPSTAGVQLLEANSFEHERELQPADSFKLEASPLVSRPN